MSEHLQTATAQVVERRSRLIRAGRLLFAERGYALVSIQAVLRQAGLGGREFAEDFHGAFANLDALLAAVHDQILDEVIAAGCFAIDPSDDPSDAARAMIDGMVGLLESDPGGARILLHEVTSSGPIAALHRQAGLRRLARLVADLLPKSPDHPDEHRLHLGIGLIAAGDTFLRDWCNGEPGSSRQRVVRLAMTTFDAAISVV